MHFNPSDTTKSSWCHQCLHKWIEPPENRRVSFWHMFVAAVITQILFLYFFWIFRNIPVVVLTSALLTFSVAALYQKSHLSAALCCSTQLIFLIYLITSLLMGSLTQPTTSSIESSIIIYSAVMTCIISLTVILATLSLAISLRYSESEGKHQIAQETPAIAEQEIAVIGMQSTKNEAKDIPHKGSHYFVPFHNKIQLEKEDGFRHEILAVEDGPLEKSGIRKEVTMPCMTDIRHQSIDLIAAVESGGNTTEDMVFPSHYVLKGSNESQGELTEISTCEGRTIRTLNDTNGTYSASSLFSVVQKHPLKSTPLDWLTSSRSEMLQKSKSFIEEEYNPLDSIRDQVYRFGHESFQNDKFGPEKAEKVTDEALPFRQTLRKTVLNRMGRATSALHAFQSDEEI